MGIEYRFEKDKVDDIVYDSGIEAPQNPFLDYVPPFKQPDSLPIITPRNEESKPAYEREQLPVPGRDGPEMNDPSLEDRMPQERYEEIEMPHGKSRKAVSVNDYCTWGTDVTNIGVYNESDVDFTI